MYMSSVIQISPCFKSLQRAETLCISYDLHRVSQCFSNSTFKTASLVTNSVALTSKVYANRGHIKALTNFSEEGPVQGIDSTPLSVELEPITSESQFDRVIAGAQHLEESLIIVWMASWCRKCIYLKPKLEKLAADYHPRIRFYCIDVNTVSHKLVNRAGVTKMPTIQVNHLFCLDGRIEQSHFTLIIKSTVSQLWMDSKKQAEVIGGHKAYLVVNEVREMIDNECSM